MIQGHLDVVKYLSESGADINKADVNGITPLYAAAQNVRTRIGHDDWTCVYSYTYLLHMNIFATSVNAFIYMQYMSSYVNVHVMMLYLIR